MKVYIAGPMRGYPHLNFPAFDKAKELWQNLGHNVVTPADLDRAMGMDPFRDNPEQFNDPIFLRRAISLDIEIIKTVDAIALLNGWQHSAGVAVELVLAQFLSLEIYDAHTKARLFPKLYYTTTPSWND